MSDGGPTLFSNVADLDRAQGRLDDRTFQARVVGYTVMVAGGAVMVAGVVTANPAAVYGGFGIGVGGWGTMMSKIGDARVDYNEAGRESMARRTASQASTTPANTNTNNNTQDDRPATPADVAGQGPEIRDETPYVYCAADACGIAMCLDDCPIDPYVSMILVINDLAFTAATLDGTLETTLRLLQEQNILSSAVTIADRVIGAEDVGLQAPLLQGNTPLLFDQIRGNPAMEGR